MALVTQFLGPEDFSGQFSSGIRDAGVLQELGTELRRLDQQFLFDQQANPLRLSQLEENLRASRNDNRFDETTFDSRVSQVDTAASIGRDEAEVSQATVGDRITTSSLGVTQAQQATIQQEADLQSFLTLLGPRLQRQLQDLEAQGVVVEREFGVPVPQDNADVSSTIGTVQRFIDNIPQVAQRRRQDADTVAALSQMVRDLGGDPNPVVGGADKRNDFQRAFDREFGVGPDQAQPAPTRRVGGTSLRGADAFPDPNPANAQTPTGASVAAFAEPGFDPIPTANQLGFRPTSGFRTRAHQADLRRRGLTSTTNSQHTAGNAVDFAVPQGMTKSAAIQLARRTWPGARVVGTNGHAIHVTFPGWGGAPDVSGSRRRFPD